MSRNTKLDNNMTSIKTEDKLISNTDEMAETFNQHFTEMGSKLASKLEQSSKSFEDFIAPAQSYFHPQSVNRNFVLKLLTTICSTKATGLDGLPCRLIKEAATAVAKSLTDILTKSLETGIFPSDWKIAKVTPLHKAKEKDLVTNYRPISVIPAIAKVFERLVYNQLYEYLHDRKLLSKCQSGFWFLPITCCLPSDMKVRLHTIAILYQC